MKGAKAIIFFLLVAAGFCQGLAGPDEVASTKPESAHKLSWFFPWWIPRGWPFGRLPCPPAHPPSAATQHDTSAKLDSGHELSWFFPWWIPRGWPCPPAHPPLAAAQLLAMNRRFMASHLDNNDVASAKPESGHELSWFFPWWIPRRWPIGGWPCPPAHPPSASAQQLAMNGISQGLDDIASAKPESGHELSWFFPWWIPRGWPIGGRWPCPPAHPPLAAAQQLAMNRKFMVSHLGSTN